MFLREQLESAVKCGLAPGHLLPMREAVATFVEREVVPASNKVAADARHLPADVLKALQEKARKLGYWMFAAPAELGGAGLNTFENCVILEETVKSRFAFSSRVFGYEPPPPLYSGSPEQLEEFVKPAIAEGWATFTAISEPGGGSDPARAIRTTAVRKGDKYVLNGQKLWITNADEAAFGIVFARTAPGRGGISAFILPAGTPGMHIRPVPVLRDHWSTELTLDNCEIPARLLVGEEGQGFALAGKWTHSARLYIAAFCLGVAEAAVRMAIDWAKQRETFGAPLATRQSVQFTIADAVVSLQSARWLLWQAAVACDRGDDVRIAVSAAKYRCSEVSFKILDEMVQIFGGMGVAKEYPLEHWYRDVRVCRIVDGPTEVHKYVIARELLGPLATAIPNWKGLND